VSSGDREKCEEYCRSHWWEGVYNICMDFCLGMGFKNFYKAERFLNISMKCMNAKDRKKCEERYLQQTSEQDRGPHMKNKKRPKGVFLIFVKRE